MRATDNLNAVKERRRILLVDQFPITRTAVCEWLKQTPDLTVSAETDNPASAFNVLSHLKPDIVITEILYQQDLGFIKGLHKRYPRLPLLVFSFRDEEWYAARALEAGADGYLMKGVGRQALIQGIRRALEGDMVLSPRMRVRLLRKRQRTRRQSIRTAKRRRGVCFSKPASQKRRLRGLRLNLKPFIEPRGGPNKR